MAGVVNWLRAAGNRLFETSNLIFDPNRELRIATQAVEMWKHIAAYKRAFNFEASCIQLGVEDQDRRDVAGRVYLNALAKAWQSGSIDAKERQSLNLIAQLLGMSNERRSRLELETGGRLFGEALRAAVADGEVSPAEKAELEQLAAGIGVPVRDLVRQSFADEGGQLLRSAMEAAIRRGQFTSTDWQRMVTTAAALGMTEAEVQAAVAPQAGRVVEAALAGAKADGEVTDQEADGLRWLMDTFGIYGGHRAYVENQIREVNELAAIRRGRLPSVDAGGLQLRGGEIVHYQGRGYYTRVRVRRGEHREEQFDGHLAVTDDRLLFVSPLLSVDLGHRRVANLLLGHGVAEVQTAAKGAGCYYFETQPERGPLIYQVAIGRANQTITQAVEGSPSRHIPRHVRQRVWQTYGGKCAECGATDYLEYDHIIPHARGGSNDEKNVQLLCRRCNGAKSDLI